MMENSKLKPAKVFEQFAQINKIPRPSKHEEKMIEYLKQFGKEHGLETLVDETGNVLIRKQATPGYENKATTIMQSHMDMVCDKLVDVDFDFSKDAIQTYVDGDWMHAKGTTLGADDGIGCAIELAILDSDDIEHGPIECVFTRDEETQLTGAFGLKAGFMTGQYLINLDSEDEGQIFVSCAGGRSTTATFKYTREEAPQGYAFLEGSVKGLKGGHSGDDIEKKRANAIKIIARFLYNEQDKTTLYLAQFNSGKLHNAIPRDGKFVIAVPDDFKDQVKADWNVFTAQVQEEFHVTDTNMQFALVTTDREKVIPQSISSKMIMALQAVDNGVFAITQEPELNGMVETSSNTAVVRTDENEATILASQRSNVMSNLENQINTISAVYRLAGAEVEHNDGYPAWKMKSDGKLTQIAVKAYEKLFNKEPVVRGIHAGLECGLFSERYPDLDMVSFGPTLRHVHTPDECLYIPTVEMVWNHLLEILKNIPEK